MDFGPREDADGVSTFISHTHDKKPASAVGASTLSSLKMSGFTLESFFIKRAPQKMTQAMCTKKITRPYHRYLVQRSRSQASSHANMDGLFTLESFIKRAPSKNDTRDVHEKDYSSQFGILDAATKPDTPIAIVPHHRLHHRRCASRS